MNRINVFVGILAATALRGSYAAFAAGSFRRSGSVHRSGWKAFNRRTALAIIGASTIGASGVALAKEKHHLNGNALLGDKIKQNGKHKIHKAGNVDVYAEVSNGKVVGVSAAGMQVQKVKSSQKLAETAPELILASMQLAQDQVYYYGYWVYDPVADYYYWFTSDVVIVDASWAPYP
jgi:hypothetical protein